MRRLSKKAPAGCFPFLRKKWRLKIASSGKRYFSLQERANREKLA
jgi:hypothetical protein